MTIGIQVSVPAPGEIVRLSYKRIGQLDDLRAIAITLVLAMHSYAAFFPRPNEIYNPLLIFIFAGGTGVTLFFILSGYLVSLPFIRAGENTYRHDVAEHFKQRSLRILPTYYFFVLAGCVITGKYEFLVPAMLFLVSGNELGAYSGVWWSLATEIQFYIVMPLLFLLRRQGYMLAGLFFLWLFTYIYFAEYLIPRDFSKYVGISTSLLFKAPAFIVGVGLAYMTTYRIKFAHNAAPTLYTIAISALVFFLKYKAENAGIGYDAVHPYGIIAESILWGLIFYLFLQNKLSIFGRAGYFLSKISFSLYLVHLPIILIMVMYSNKYSDAGDSVKYIALAVSLLLSICLAWLSYVFIEKPFLRLKSKVKISNAAAV